MPKKFNLIWYFSEVLKSFIKAEIENQVDEYKDWNKFVKKTIAIEAKAALQPSLNIYKIDKYYLLNNYSYSITNISKYQGSIINDLLIKNSKPKNFDLSLGSNLIS